MNTKNNKVKVIGAGLAGCECALFLANNNIQVELYEMKPDKKTPAHKSNKYAELVCSNSLKSTDLTTASGLLKKELETLGCSLLKIAKENSVEAGSALAVDREEFSRLVTEEIEILDNVEIIREEFAEELNNEDVITIIATGPLTSEKMEKQIRKLTGEDKLYFYDAAAPIVERDSIDMDIAFYGDRYSQEKKKEESVEEWQIYIAFITFLIR